MNINVTFDPNINALRRAVVIKAFADAAGRRTLIMTAQYPYTYIGEIMKVVGDYLYLHTETTNISELDDRTFRIHIDDIEVFYIENGGPPIPKII